MLKKLIKLANHLDKIGLQKEASILDSLVEKNIEKLSQEQHGIFQHFQSSELDYNRRDELASERSGNSVDRSDSSNLYGVFPEQNDADNQYSEPQRSLSTRYSPDRVGVQARRLSDGVYQDPYTNKVYDYSEGFKTESGEEFSPSSVDNQTKLYPM
tara:strand:+ start:7260 stop:7727 length:468 start_codon:yes stop_codon:yes gene_type:complete